MKLSEIEVGGRYRAKVSQRLVVVRVTKFEQVPAFSATSGNHYRTRIEVVNETTGRPLIFRSTQRLRSRVVEQTDSPLTPEQRKLPAAGCEFCRQEFNRPNGEFTCSYCGKVWSGG